MLEDAHRVLDEESTLLMDAIDRATDRHIVDGLVPNSFCHALDSGDDARGGHESIHTIFPDGHTFFSDFNISVDDAEVSVDPSHGAVTLAPGA